MKEDLISVIIPCYNGGKYLAQALESVRLQTYPHWECILIDDGSIDDSKEIFKSFMERDKRFKYVYQENQGPAIARNKGVDIASGDFIQFLDADDILLPERFELCMEQFRLNPEIDVVYTDYICFNLDSAFMHFLPAQIPYEDTARAFMFHLDIDFVILIHSFLFKKKITKNHKFDVSMESRAEDTECWIRVALSGAKFFYLDKVLAIYRHMGSTLTGNEVKLYSAKLKVLGKYKFHPKTVEYNSEYQRAFQHFSERLAIAYIMNREFSKGIQKMREIWQLASTTAKLKFIFWVVLMFFFKKKFVFRMRDKVLKKFKEANKSISNWQPPEIINKLLYENL